MMEPHYFANAPAVINNNNNNISAKNNNSNGGEFNYWASSSMPQKNNKEEADDDIFGDDDDDEKEVSSHVMSVRLSAQKRLNKMFQAGIDAGEGAVGGAGKGSRSAPTSGRDRRKDSGDGVKAPESPATPSSEADDSGIFGSSAGSSLGASSRESRMMTTTKDSPLETPPKPSPTKNKFRAAASKIPRHRVFGNPADNNNNNNNNNNPGLP